MIDLTMLVCDWIVCAPRMDSLRIVTFVLAAFTIGGQFRAKMTYFPQANLNIVCLLSCKLRLKIMDWIYIGLFSPLKALYIESLIDSRHIHTGGGRAPCVATAALRQTGTALAANQHLRPPTIIHSHFQEAVWV